AAQVVHALQPDAVQASALAAALCVVATRSRGGRTSRHVLWIIALVGAAVAWQRPVVVPAMAFVGGVVAEALRLSPWLFVGALLSLVALAVEPLRLSRVTADARTRTGALAVGAY